MSYLQTKLEAVGAPAVGFLSTLLGSQLGWIEMGADVFVAFVLGASGAAGGYVVKEGLNWIIKRVKGKTKND